LRMKNVHHDKTVSELIELLTNSNTPIACAGLSGSDRAYLISRIAGRLNRTIAVVADSSKTAESFIGDLKFFLNQGDDSVYYFPPYNLLPFKTLSYHNETATRRIRTLYQMTSAHRPGIVVTTVGGMMHKLVPKNRITDYAELVMAEEDIDRDALIEKLVAGGYTRTGIVEEHGDFCIRGGILDIFSPMYDDPLRIELFGDTVDSIRFFSAVTQRKLGEIQEAIILPAREVILEKTELTEIVARIRERAYLLETPVTRVREIVDRISREGLFPGIESMIPMIYPALDSFVDYLPKNALMVTIEPADLDSASKTYVEQIQKNYDQACEQKNICADPSSLYEDWREIRKRFSNRASLSLSALGLLSPENAAGDVGTDFQFNIEDNSQLTFDLKNLKTTQNPLSPLLSWIKTQKSTLHNILMVCQGNSQADRLASLLDLHDIKADVYDEFPDGTQNRETVAICIGRLGSGFVWLGEMLSVITGNEIFGRKIFRGKPAKKEVRTDLLIIEDLKAEDLVVHSEHGIGRYKGLMKLNLNGSANDFLLIVYKESDKLYLPVDRMGLIQKYMGVDGIVPVLDKLGGKTWDRVKDKVKKSTEKIAGELLKLYAERRTREGYSFENIDAYFREFESGFPYEETEDQKKAIDHVLEDMMSPVPMDRLVCGDVGYGKTEVALRASFLAVHSGKQVAVLVPTTVLAEQHLTTFTSRFQEYPVKIACLSRFRSNKEQREIINDVKAGKIDIVIGTHRLIQKDVGFKDLGLFVIDEEQRFGVKHKEKLKKMRTTVDVLALTATPIPRTLHMSMLGIRDVTVISTPPEYRRAIITYISEFDDAVVSEAIKREMDRGGQIFFVHNNIHNIHRVAEKIKNLVPEVRMDVAHGRMKEDRLEEVMVNFMRRETDLLVCTTIIESGLDIPSVNTILVNRADKFGLAQIYQLRGRVGRSDEQAYAYLFIPRESALTKDAQKRLKVLMEYSDLGSGFQIAMSDLKIRGGGTILGASQSGHIAAVGYDMFLTLMEESIAEMKGEPILPPLDPEINVALSAFIPESYISDIDQRLTAYRRLAKMTSLTDIADFKLELSDRFGPLPDETANLLMKIMLKVLSRNAGIKRLDLIGGELHLFFSQTHMKEPHGMMKMVSDKTCNISFMQDNSLKIKLIKQHFKTIMGETKNILKEIARHVNPDTL
jgi:transcription-repair coupling factor (superfamily II helicase)